MGIVVARLVFLAFVGLTGCIIYNALYLQEQRNAASLPSIIPVRKPLPPASVPAVTTDLPTPRIRNGPQQLVTAIQRELSARGYGGGPVDGKLHDATRKAIASFEKDHGLPETGLPSDELLRHILLGEAAAPAASTGSVANAAQVGAQVKPSSPAQDASTVKEVQQILADLGYAPGPIDGAIGSETRGAISAFQRDRKIAPTGRITVELVVEIKRITGRDLAANIVKP